MKEGYYTVCGESKNRPVFWALPLGGSIKCPAVLSTNLPRGKVHCPNRTTRASSIDQQA